MFAFAPTSFLGTHLYRPASPSVCRSAPQRSHLQPRASLGVDVLKNKSYQLEEDEDALSCTSAIYLNADGTLKIGRTDGPRPDKVDASWQYNPDDGELLLEIERFFDESGRTPFSVKRVLRGHLDETQKNLAGLPVFAGGMYQWPADFSQKSEVGWWTMILAVDDLPEDTMDISNVEQ